MQRPYYIFIIFRIVHLNNTVIFAATFFKVGLIIKRKN
jgi:hypothetical protein